MDRSLRYARPIVDVDPVRVSNHVHFDAQATIGVSLLSNATGTRLWSIAPAARWHCSYPVLIYPIKV
jgi:hypothetical protein